ncbi:MAG: phosphatidate cytidylyltransferase [Caldicoprobacterales bacterium]|jgi:phosphatidate cytidylyltransferase|nr:phosphatidate cytidylyltransferase [Clostridiales bacterium]
MLAKRVASAVVAIILLIVVLWIGGWVFDLAVLTLSLIGMREIYRAFENNGNHPQKTAGYLIAALFHIQHYLFSGSYDFFFIMTAVVFLLSVLIWKTNVRPVDIAVTILGVFYPGILLTTAAMMRKAAIVHPYYLLIMSLTATYSTDTCAYFTGRLFGRRKLCPAVSPKKTVEGSIGGLIGSFIFILMLGFILNWVYNTHVHPIHFVFIGLLGGIFSQIGDLTASAIKRCCGLKDFGNIMPGHGGILDRIDSLLFVLPIIYVYSQLVLVG